MSEGRACRRLPKRRAATARATAPPAAAEGEGERRLGEPSRGGQHLLDLPRPGRTGKGTRLLCRGGSKRGRDPTRVSAHRRFEVGLWSCPGSAVSSGHSKRGAEGHQRAPGQGQQLRDKPQLPWGCLTLLCALLTARGGKGGLLPRLYRIAPQKLV